MRQYSTSLKLMSKFTRWTFAIGVGTLLLAGGGHAKEKKGNTPIFFPPPPDQAKIQFLTSFSTDDELADLGGKRKFLKFVVGDERAERTIYKPYGVSGSPGKLLVCDSSTRSIAVADLAKWKMAFFTPGGDGTLGFPVNIAVDSDGIRYITDTKRNQVIIFNGDKYAGSIGVRDEMRPIGVAVSKSRIYVTDLLSQSVRVYDKAGRKLLFTFPKPGSEDAAKLFAPTNIAVDGKDRVYVSDTGGFCVNVYDADGKFLRKVGEQGLSPGKFALPKGIAVDREGRSYVVDAKIQLVQLFDPEGRILMYFGDPMRTSGGGTSLPAGIAIDYDNVEYFKKFAAPDFKVEYLILLINQTGGRKVNVFGFGQRK